MSSESEEQEAHGGDDEDPTATLDPASGSDAPAPSARGSGLACSGAGLAALEEFSQATFEEEFGPTIEEAFGDVASGSEELAAQPPPARRPRLAPRSVPASERAEVVSMSLEEARRRYVLSLGSLAEEWAAADEFVWVQGRDAPPPDCGDGSVEEELAAADQVVLDLDLGAGLEVEAPAAKRLRVS